MAGLSGSPETLTPAASWNLLGRLKVPGWALVAAGLLTAYGFRHRDTLTQRCLMWDDFMLLTQGASIPRFAHYFLYTFLHFIPFLRLSMFGFMECVPLKWLPVATSLWAVFWVGWLALAFFRLMSAYGISPWGSLLGISFIVFNPMFAEDQIWLTSTYYLVGLVFTVEGLVQLEGAVRTDSSARWAAACVCATLAPCAWSTGYIVGLFYVASLFFERSRLKKNWKAAATLGVSFLAYPALRLLGEYVAGSTYLGVSAWTLKALVENMSKIVGDGLVFGSLGLWKTPLDGVSIPSGLQRLATLAVLTGMAVPLLYKAWRKQAALALIAVCVGLAVPLYFRGTQFPYEYFRWFIRYFTTPLFGVGLMLAVGAHLLLARFRWAKHALIVAMAGIVCVSFHDRMPEYYVGGGTPIGRHFRFRRQQVKQLDFLAKFFAQARQLDVGASALLASYYFPVEGSQANINCAGLYKGSREPNDRPMTPSTQRALDDFIVRSGAWKLFEGLSYVIQVPENMLTPPPPEPGERRAWLLGSFPEGTSKGFEVVSTLRDGGPHTLKVVGEDPYVVYPVPEGFWNFRKLIVDIEVKDRPDATLQLTFVSADPRLSNPSITLACGPSRRLFYVPLARLVWLLHPGPYSHIRIDVDRAEGADVLLRNLSVVL